MMRLATGSYVVPSRSFASLVQLYRACHLVSLTGSMKAARVREGHSYDKPKNHGSRTVYSVSSFLCPQGHMHTAAFWILTQP